MNFLLGFSASLLSTIVFAYILFGLLKPKIEISDSIAYQDDGNKKIYKIKFYNKSMFKAFDVKYELLSCRESEATKNTEGVNVKITNVRLVNSEFLFVSKYKSSKKGRYANNCVLVTVKESDLKSLVSKENSYLEFRITLKHGFSNLSNTFTKNTEQKNVLLKVLLNLETRLKLLNLVLLSTLKTQHYEKIKRRGVLTTKVKKNHANISVVFLFAKSTH